MGLFGRKDGGGGGVGGDLEESNMTVVIFQFLGKDIEKGDI